MMEQPISPEDESTCEVCGRESARPVCRDCRHEIAAELNHDNTEPK
jgi:hypothetical protein